MSNMEWLDELLEDEPISNSQIAIIEGLLSRVPYDPETVKDVEMGLLHLTYEEAYQLIVKLKEDEIPTDPREQFKKIFRYGN